MLNLDTHILIGALAGDLRPREKRLLLAQEWSVSAIVLWEIAKLAQLGRIEIDLDDADVRRALTRIHTWPIDVEVCRALKKLDFSGDPADEIIGATSLVHHVPLVTRDRRICKSKLVPLAIR